MKTLILLISLFSAAAHAEIQCKIGDAGDSVKIVNEQSTFADLDRLTITLKENGYEDVIQVAVSKDNSENDKIAFESDILEPSFGPNPIVSGGIDLDIGAHYVCSVNYATGTGGQMTIHSPIFAPPRKIDLHDCHGYI